jgi:hypothetical protein
MHEYIEMCISAILKNVAFTWRAVVVVVKEEERASKREKSFTVPLSP